MINYDNDVLGTENPEHPANQKETPHFESNNLQECLDYYKETGDSEPLENAIFHTEKAKERAVKDITEVIKLQREHGNGATANFLCTIRDLLK